MKLSVIIPVYNEIHTLDTVLAKVIEAIPEVPKEIVMVDDGSTDGTREWLMQTFGRPNAEPVSVTLNAERQLILAGETQERRQATRNNLATYQEAPVTVKTVFHQKNKGKGAALRTGFQESTGDVLIIQDADLEYDPKDWKEMWSLMVEGYADVVYGSRFYGKPHRVLYVHHLFANKLISNLINLLCNTTLTDIEVCYKMFRREVLEGMKLTCNDFGFEVEFTVKITKSRRRWRIYETGVCYYGRSYAEGKKINWKDGVKALWYILKFWIKF
jgi:glycosyltransferase involved in cell wall biosynthesis